MCMCVASSLSPFCFSFLFLFVFLSFDGSETHIKINIKARLCLNLYPCVIKYYLIISLSPPPPPPTLCPPPPPPSLSLHPSVFFLCLSSFTSHNIHEITPITPQCHANSLPRAGQENSYSTKTEKLFPFSYHFSSF